ncbi:hypothetical protein ACFV0L_03095 [Streptosporangium canum]|uniref:hypothetical protein n=1 Tax=Streptosporangium canum TaxID=324952 RepID=UPI0036CAB76A
MTAADEVGAVTADSVAVVAPAGEVAASMPVAVAPARARVTREVRRRAVVVVVFMIYLREVPSY